MEGNPQNRITELDGWRGVAILLVLFDHIQTQWLGHYLPYLQTGQHGVTLFFVLSGFLITSNLLKSGNLKTFYIRRFFRLMPVAWSYIAFIWLLGLKFPFHAASSKDLISCLLFFRNYVPTQALLPTGHFWSLSIEEQFYLVWPALLIIMKPKRAAWFVAITSVACAAIRVSNWAFYNHNWPSFRTEVRADALCIGCLLAFVMRNDETAALLSRFAHAIRISSALVFAACCALFTWLPPTIESMAAAGLIASSLALPSRLLKSSPLVLIGTISYSLYVWNSPFMSHFDRTTDIVLDCLCPFAAIASYFLIERPSISFGRFITSAPVPSVEVGFQNR